MSSLPIVVGEASTYLEVVHCAACGTAFAIESNLRRCLRETHDTFYCPAGHSNVYTGKSEAEKLRQELEARTAALVKAEQARVAAERESFKLKKRIKNGVCPCCKRSFVCLRRHIATKHPEYAKVQEIGKK